MNSSRSRTFTFGPPLNS